MLVFLVHLLGKVVCGCGTKADDVRKTERLEPHLNLFTSVLLNRR